MLASQIIHALAASDGFLLQHHRVLPPSPKLDVTDFGLQRFGDVGLVACVLTNQPGMYCSKWLVLTDNQTCPMHYHRVKQEDIAVEIGTLLMQISGQSLNDQSYDDRERRVTVLLDGVAEDIDCGEEGRLLIQIPGRRITLPPGVWHEFTAVGGTALAVEVSTWNDDVDDNVFDEKEIGRFVQTIEQDVMGVKVSLTPAGFIEINQVI